MHALRATEKALPLAERAYQLEPGVAENQYALAKAWLFLGDGHQAMGRGDEARAAHRRALELIEEVAGPGSKPGFRHLLFMAHGRAGMIARDRGDPAKALEHWTEHERLGRELVASNPSWWAFSYGYSGACAELCNWWSDAGDHDEALSWAERALESAEQAVALQPGDRRILHVLANRRLELADVLFERGDLAAAEELLGQCREATEDGVAADPDNLEVRRDLFRVWMHLGRLYRAMDEPVEAEARGSLLDLHRVRGRLEAQMADEIADPRERMEVLERAERSLATALTVLDENLRTGRPPRNAARNREKLERDLADVRTALRQARGE